MCVCRCFLLYITGIIEVVCHTSTDSCRRISNVDTVLYWATELVYYINLFILDVMDMLLFVIMRLGVSNFL